MWKKWRRVFTRILSLLFILAVIIFGVPVLITQIFARSRIYTVEQSPSAPVALVFGAGLNFDGTPTVVLQDRVATAAELYTQGKVQKLLMSGDNRFLDYNEPGAMYNYALALGIPAEDIVMDFGGRRTYDSCYRASAIFGVQEAILVTQRYHLPRALFLCNRLGIRANGVAADKVFYTTRSFLVWRAREVAATLVSFRDIWQHQPPPVMGDPEPVFPPE